MCVYDMCVRVYVYIYTRTHIYVYDSVLSVISDIYSGG